MTKGLIAIFMAVVVYIAVNTLLASLVTGTAVGDTLLKSLLPLAIAIGAVVLALTMFIRQE